MKLKVFAVFLLDIHQICSRLGAVSCKKIGGVDGLKDREELQDNNEIR